jgi:glycerol-3-phosphate acyltransferase PlsX
MFRIALDAMGGDNAPAEVVRGGLMAVREQDDISLVLVGREEKVAECLEGEEYPAGRVDVLHAPEVVSPGEAPVMAVRRKRDSSMMTALRLVGEKEAQACVSAGNTGALMAGGLFVLGRMEGIDRPALTVIIPRFDGGGTVLLDVGANMDARAEHLAQYALMGSIYAREVLGRAEPKVALLNVGSEENKGNEQVRQAFGLLKEKLPGFAGNVEARDIFSGSADVVICDGFTGNIVLKTVEGLAAGIFGSLKEILSADLRTRLGASLILPRLREFRARLDYAEYGGAPLLGLDGVCIKAHGSSGSRAIRSAIINQAYLFDRRDVNQQIRKQLSSLQAREDE